MFKTAGDGSSSSGSGGGGGGDDTVFFERNLLPKYSTYLH
jgi:hypothetical protein